MRRSGRGHERGRVFRPDYSTKSTMTREGIMPCSKPSARSGDASRPLSGNRASLVTHLATKRSRARLLSRANCMAYAAVLTMIERVAYALVQVPETFFLNSGPSRTDHLPPSARQSRPLCNHAPSKDFVRPSVDKCLPLVDQQSRVTGPSSDRSMICSKGMTLLDRC